MRILSRSLSTIAIAIASACSNEPASVDKPPDAPPPKDTIVDDCDGMPAVEYFETVPAMPGPAIHAFADTSCGESKSSVLVVNATDEAVRIAAVGMTRASVDVDSPADESARFVASARGLPRELGPHEALAVVVEFSAEVPGVTAFAGVVVATPDGCQTLGELQGIHHPEEEGVAIGPRVIDFGTLRPGATGQVIDAEWTYKRAKLVTEYRVGCVATLPSDVFELLKPFERTLSDGCEHIAFSMRMTAPDVVGPVDGKLFCETLSATTSAVLSGAGYVPLRGLVRE